MRTTVAAIFFLAAGCCGWAKAETEITARLKAELRETHPYVAPAAQEAEPDAGGEPVLRLEPMVVTSSRAFAVDVLAEARRAVAAREAVQFSLRKGGTLFSSYRGDLGFWPSIVPVDAGPVKKGDVALRVDLLRLKW